MNERISLGTPIRSAGKELIYTCPSCGGYGKLWQNDETGAYVCYKCGLRGMESRGVTTESVLNMLVPRRAAYEWPEVRLPDWTPLTRTARKYLRDRGIHGPEKFGIVSLKDEPRILIPYFGPKGAPIYWTTRSYDYDGKPKYVGMSGRKPLYVLPYWTGTESTVTVVEGPIDAMVTHLATGKPVVAIGGKSIAPYNRCDLSRICMGGIEVMLDSDAMGTGIKLARELGATIKTLPGGMDPADYYKEKIMEEAEHE